MHNKYQHWIDRSGKRFGPVKHVVRGLIQNLRV